MHAKYCIIGAGPTGLGAGYGLTRQGEDDVLILEQHSAIGGRAASVRDAAGFTWDLTSLPVASHSETFNRLCDDLLGPDAQVHEREAWIRAGGAWVPYPFQNNLRYLPRTQRLACVQGLVPKQGDPAPPDHLAQWIEARFGSGIAELFLVPYNEKRWATPLDELDFGWAGKRMSPAPLTQVLEGLILERDDTDFGIHTRFRTPAFGGTAELFKRMAKRLRDRILIGQQVTGIDPVARQVHVRGAEPVSYEHLLCTMPLDALVLNVLADVPEPVRRAAMELRHTSSAAVGIGIDGGRQSQGHWMYFPQDNCPFHRVTNLHAFSDSRTPSGSQARALLAETNWCGEAGPAEVVQQTIDGLINANLMREEERSQILSTWSVIRQYEAPLPDLNRDAALGTIVPYLTDLGLASRGRFGGWMVESGDLDQCVLQGIEWARHMVHGSEEKTYQPPVGN